MSSVLDEKGVDAESLDESIVSGSTLAAIYHMSWPMLVQMLIISAASFADVYVAGKLGSETQAAIGICNQVWFLMILMTIALSSGTMALISRFWGARDYDSAIEAGRQSLIFSFIFGVLSTLAGLLVAKPVLSMTGASPAVQELSWRFLQIDLLSQLPFTLVWTCHSMFRAIGNSRVPMLIWLAMASLIITLNFTLCLGPPKLGIIGIALAWTIAGCLGVVLNLWLLRSSDLKASLDIVPALKEGLSPRTREWIWRILKVGMPTCIQDLAWVLGNFAMFLIFAMTKNPTATQAAWTIGFRLEEMICTLPLHALGASIGTIVGQNLGAKKPERASRTGWQAAGIGLGIEIPTAVAMYIFAEPIAHLMTSDPLVLASTADYLRIVGLSEPLVACWIILFGALTGAGYTKWPMWIGIVGLTCVRLPLAYILAINCHMGANGIWLSIAISSSLIGLMAIARFKSGVWKTQQV
ncbi:MAG: MATE family efflux transporter [Cyanobacteria bacterium REEB67]|nr:MATE family efflux transporter [Cyanobacteria bacterium REEB67]